MLRVLDRIAADFEACGLAGAATNRLVGDLAAVSRKLLAPQAVLVQSSSVPAKSSLMDAVLAFVPEAECVRYSAITGPGLFYMGGAGFAAPGPRLVRGGRREPRRLRAQTAAIGRLARQHQQKPGYGGDGDAGLRVEGPVMLFLTTTAIELDEELLNRCQVQAR